jgi:putative nucleotidyltransferase with HDIG domain
VTARPNKPVLPPPFPAVALQLIRQMQDTNVSVADVGRLIELDPSLTASLLRLVNSPFFGMRREIGGVSEAVMVLGMSAVRRMVLSLAMATPLRRADIDPNFARQQWHHTVSCAALARRLIDDDQAASELAFTAGLLHDIGQVHLLQLHGAAYVRLYDDNTEEGIRAAECEHFGQAHDTLGAELLEGWGLPQPIADAARHHHHAQGSIGQLTPIQQAVWVANKVASRKSDSPPEPTIVPDTLAPVEQAMEDARAEIETLSAVLKV